MLKTILFGEEAREKVLAGVNKITKAVASTLGPKGRTVLISRGYVDGSEIRKLPVVATKDGVSVARAFELSDHVEGVGVDLIKSAAQKTVEQAGDATTSTCVLAQSMIETGIKSVNQPSGFNPLELKKGMDAATKAVVAELDKMTTPIAGNIERIKQVATVSANNDDEIGSIIAEAYSKVGDEGIINIEDAKGFETTLKVTEGFAFDRSYISQQFIRDWSKRTCVFPDEIAPNPPYILLHDRPITQIKTLHPIIQKVQQAQRSLLIIAPDVDGEALAFLTINNANRSIAVCAVKTPFGGEKADDTMHDIAALTGATYISNLAGIKLENVQLSHLGEAEKIVVTKQNTTIIGGKKDESKKDVLVKRLHDNRDNAKDDDEKNTIEERLARLNGAVAVIQVGANTEIEQKEKKDRIEDAVLSVRAAIREGFIAGGGTALLRARRNLSYDTIKGTEFMAGQEIVFTALDKPFMQICENAGVKGGDMLIEVLKEANPNVGYNAQTETVEDLVQSGIIDATKVIKTALINATSVAGTLLTAECLIVDNY
jgi:chaperonin GroEL